MKFLTTLLVCFLFASLVVLNLAQCLSFFVLRPFSQKAFRKLNASFAGLWWGWCVKTSRWLHKPRLLVSGDPIPTDENAIVLLNHRSMTDIPVILDFAFSKGRLSDLKWFVKDILKYVPGPGWGMVFLDCLFIKRNWTEDRSYIAKMFSQIIRYRVPVWVMMFAEGTRATPSKIEKSRAYARKNNLPVLNHVLIPRTKGFVASIEGLGSHLQAVYHFTMGYDPPFNTRPPTLSDWIYGRVRSVRLHVTRTPVTHLPSGEEALSKWLIDKFCESDQLLETWLSSGQPSS